MSSPDPPEVAASGVGLGYGIAIAVSILVLISTIMLASYACVKVKANSGSRGHRLSTNIARNNHSNTAATRGSHHQVAAEPTVVVIGLDGSVIESYKKIELGESKRLPEPNDGPCSICLSDYKAKDVVRCVPECNHCFHAECIDEWLRICGSCPLCRNSPAPSVVSTPLSDSVPLALHPR